MPHIAVPVHFNLHSYSISLIPTAAKPLWKKYSNNRILFTWYPLIKCHLGSAHTRAFPRQCPLFLQHFSLGIPDPFYKENWISREKNGFKTGFQTLNLHVSTHKTVIGSERWVIEAPVQQVVVTCIEIPKKKKKKFQFKGCISSLVLTQGKAEY